MSQYSTKVDLDNFIKDSGINLEAIKKDLSKLSASIAAANQVVVVSDPQNQTNLPSTSTTHVDGTPANSTDPYGYYSNVQNLQLNEDFASVKVPIGQVGFSAWKDKPWSISIPQREYEVITVLGQDENERIYAYNKFNINVDNKSYDVKINSSKIVQEYPDAKFSWWNPRISIGANVGISLPAPQADIAPGIYFSPFSYGRYKTRPDWLFAQIGADYSLTKKDLGFTISPAMYNLHNLVGVINNSYVGPSIGVDTKGNVSLLGTVSVSF